MAQFEANDWHLFFDNDREAGGTSEQAELEIFITGLENRLSFYGFTENPLSHFELAQLHEMGADIDTAYSFCCDVNAGFPFEYIFLDTYGINAKEHE